jgi:hypothetical protein
LFHLDWERLFEVLATVGVMAILIERALAILFEWRPFVKKFDKKGIKEPITLIVAFIVCRFWDFDAVSMIILRENTSLVGQLVTAGVLAGGAKGSIKLFREMWGWQSTAYTELNPRKK